MSGSQQGYSTPNGNIVSLDDITAILKFVDSGQPFQVHVMSSPIENGQKRTQLQIRNCTGSEFSSDTSKTGNNSKHASELYDSRALVKQLTSLQLTDKSIVEQILTSPQPAALSELTAAHSNKSMIPLVTAKDGRVFSILTAQLAYSNWAGKYPMEFSQGPMRKLRNDVLLAEKITKYQNDALMRMVREVSHTKDSYEFRKPVWNLHPEIWDNYMKLVAEPIDLDTMHHNLRHKVYVTMADFRKHVDLLEENARRYNAERNAFVIEAAIKVRSDIYRRMAEIPSEPPFDGAAVTQIRQVIFVDDDDSSSAANSDTNGSATGDESEDALCEETTGSKPEARGNNRCVCVLPLGRLCVSHSAGGVGVIITPYIVVVDLESAFKALWLIKDNYNPVGLPNDKKTLLDFGGRYNFTIGKLADDIEDWKVRQIPGPRGGLSSTKVPVLSWASVEKLVRQSGRDRPVLFDLVKNQEHAAAAIEKGWNESIPVESFEDVEDLDDDAEDEDDTNDEFEPPKKIRTRSAARAGRSSRGYHQGRH